MLLVMFYIDCLYAYCFYRINFVIIRRKCIFIIFVFITISSARKNSSFDASTLDIILTHPKLLILNPSIGAMTNWQQKTLHYLLIAGYPASLRFPIMHPFTHLFP